jgi:glycine cleavage system H protein
MTRYFTEDHEWIEVEGDSATVGITDYAQSQLGDIVFAEVPATGATLRKKAAMLRLWNGRRQGIRC